MAGKKRAAIAQKLSISQSQIKKIHEEIIEDRIKWNKKKSKLEEYYPLILSGINNRQTTKQIHETLLAMNLNMSYTTVVRAVQIIQDNKITKENLPKPGKEAKVFFLKMGKFQKQKKKVNVWLFVLRLSYSGYTYGQIVLDNNFETFLNAHVQAFKTLKGVPKEIKMVCSSSINIESPELFTRYSHFLFNQNCTIDIKSTYRNRNSCDRELWSLKKRCLIYILSRKYSDLSHQLNLWINREMNLKIHPGTGRIVKNEFQRVEQPELIPYRPVKPTRLI